MRVELRSEEESRGGGMGIQQLEQEMLATTGVCVTMLPLFALYRAIGDGMGFSAA